MALYGVTLLAECAKTRQKYVTHRTDDVNSGGFETERAQCFWIQMILPRNGILAVTNDGMTFKQK